MISSGFTIGGMAALLSPAPEPAATRHPRTRAASTGGGDHHDVCRASSTLLNSASTSSSPVIWMGRITGLA